MLNSFATLLQKNPELAVFLAIGIGTWIGRFKFKGVGFGPVTGSLIAGLLIGHLFHVPVSDTSKQLLFLLFMFGVGYSAGPGFIRGIRSGGWRWVALGIVIPVTGVLTAAATARLLGLELGYAAGMMSGGLTESPIIGTASEAIRSLPLPEAEKERLIHQIPIADALTYIFGTFGVIIFCGYVGPWLLRLDLQAEAQKLEKELGLDADKPGAESAWRMFELRAYRLEATNRLVGGSVAQAEASFLPARLFVDRIRRRGLIIEAGPGTVLRSGDVVAVIGSNEALLTEVASRSDEVSDSKLLDVPTATVEVELTNDEFTGRTLASLREDAQTARGVFLMAIRRGSASIPLTPETEVLHGDLLTLYGLAPAVDRVAALLGNRSRETHDTDLVALGLAVFAGAAAGILLTVDVAGLHLALGTSVAVLLVGLAVGWRNGTHPSFAFMPPAAVELMKTLGLAAFVSMIGLKAGPMFVEALKEVGLTVFFGGMVVTLVPQVVGLLVGRFVLKINPLLLLGALAGAQTMTAALAAVQDRSGSPVAGIGYASVVAFGHILLAIGGTALVWLLH